MMRKSNKVAAKSDRSWPLPPRRFAMRMKWHDLLFAHWPVQKDLIQSFLPKGLQVDTWGGNAWIALVPFRMTGVAPRGIPAIPWLSAFPEMNVRTYVTADGKPGVWFFSLDATNPIAVRTARFAFHLPYMDANISIRYEHPWYQYRSHRTHRNEPKADFIGRYRPIDKVFYAQPDTFEYWLTARYCMYAANRRGQIFRGEIDHPPWPLQIAELETEQSSMLDQFGIEAAMPPHLLFSKEIDVRAWTNDRVAV